MNNRTLLTLLFVLGFVGATSCGDTNQESGKDAEIAALRHALAQRPGNTVVVYATQTNTSLVAKTITNVNSNSQATSSTATFTITGTATGSASGTASSTSTNTAARE